MESESIKELINKIENEVILKNGNLLIPLHKITIANLGQNILDQENFQDYTTPDVSVISIDPVSYLLVNDEEIKEIKLNNNEGISKWIDLIKSGINVLKKK